MVISGVNPNFFFGGGAKLWKQIGIDRQVYMVA